jgi:peptidoglycan/xylan/chitin deacetylase (PgdA/CDA1 family)
MRYLLALFSVVVLRAMGAGGDLQTAPASLQGTSDVYPGYSGARLAPFGSTIEQPSSGAVLPQLPDAAGPRSVTISRGLATRRVVHLSFDAGADRGYAESILDTLAEQGVPASFGMTGRWAQAHPALIQRMAAEGHQLINHTWDHRSFTGLSDRRGRQNLAEIHQQLERTEALLVEMTGQSTKPFFRPPYGDYDNAALEATYSAGYAYNTMWTVDSFGWRRIPVADIVARSLRLAEPGAIILMHVGIESLDGPALPTLIGRLREQGYGMVSMADLFAP